MAIAVAKVIGGIGGGGVDISLSNSASPIPHTFDTLVTGMSSAGAAVAEVTVTQKRCAAILVLHFLPLMPCFLC